MNAISPLLSSFFKYGHAHFAFIHGMGGFNCIGGLAQHQNGRKIIRSYNPHTVLSNDLRDIWAVIRFERDDFSLEIGFGDMDTRLSVYISHDPVLRIALDDLLDAYDVPCDMSVYQWIKSEGIMARSLGHIGKIVQNNKRFVFKDAPDVVQDIQYKTAQKVRVAIEAQHKQTLSSLGRLGHQAFADNDYRRVIRLLRPHKKYLDPQMLSVLQQAQSSIMPKI